MNKITRSTISLLLAFILVFSSCLPIFAVDARADVAQPAKYSTEYNSGKRDVVCTTFNGTSALAYYENNGYSYDEFEDMSQTQLLAALRSLMSDTHTTLTTYANCRDMAVRTDCENEAGKNFTNDDDRTVLLLYTGYTAKRSQWNGWNREHVWPQSLGGKDDGLNVGEKLGGSDLHHVRPSDKGVNSSRGNKPFGEVGENASKKYGTEPAVGVLGGTYNSTYFEPNDNVKGDIARIILYVWVRWGAEWGAEDTSNPFNSVTEVFQSVDLLLEWCALDPVDTWEMGRNEVVQSIQGNRNVFIDYPELAWLLFDKAFPFEIGSNGQTKPMTTPSGEAAWQESCPHTSTKQGESVEATCGKNGHTGNVRCTDCNKVIVDGKVIPMTGNHAYGEITVLMAPTKIKNGVGEKTCSVCGKTSIVVLKAQYSDAELTVDILLSCLEGDAEKILFAMALGINEKTLLDALAK